MSLAAISGTRRHRGTRSVAMATERSGEEAAANAFHLCQSSAPH
uniref:Uncharacterized protein n=1 Tax=Anguilla anguilla TaxID=7936 RepID=A0A0E9TLD8_ANGAN